MSNGKGFTYKDATHLKPCFYLFVLVVSDPVHELLQQVLLLPVPVVEDVLGDVGPDVLAPGGHLAHGAAHQRHQLRNKVHEAAVIDLPKDKVKVSDVVVVGGVRVALPGGRAEEAVEDVAAGLQQILKGTDHQFFTILS